MRTGIYLEILTDKYLIHHNPLRNAYTGRIRKNIFFTITKWGVKSDRFLYIKNTGIVLVNEGIDTLITGRPQTP